MAETSENSSRNGEISTTCIVITFPQVFFKEMVPREFAQSFLTLSPTHHWLCPMANRPKKEPQWCYIVALGRLRYRAKVLGFEIGGEREFASGLSGDARHWLVLSGPVIKAPHRIIQSGFQGFRYTEFLF